MAMPFSRKDRRSQRTEETAIELRWSWLCFLAMAESGVFLRYLSEAIRIKLRNVDLNFRKEVWAGYIVSNC